MNLNMDGLRSMNPKLAAMIGQMQAADELAKREAQVAVFNAHQLRKLAAGERASHISMYSFSGGEKAAAPTGWIAPNEGIANWLVDWLHGADRWSSPRTLLASQLAYLRKAHDTRTAIGFRNAVWQMGEYPAKTLDESG